MDRELVESALRLVSDVIGFEDQGITVMIDLREGGSGFYAWSTGNGFGVREEGGALLAREEVWLERDSLAGLVRALEVERVRTVVFRFGAVFRLDTTDAGKCFWDHLGLQGGRELWLGVQADMQSLCDRARTVICLNMGLDWWRDFSRCGPWAMNIRYKPNERFLTFPRCERVITERPVYLHWDVATRRFHHVPPIWGRTVQFWGMFPKVAMMHTVTSLIHVGQTYPFQVDRAWTEGMGSFQEDMERMQEATPGYPRDRVHYDEDCTVRTGMVVKRDEEERFTVAKVSNLTNFDAFTGHRSYEGAPAEYTRCLEEVRRAGLAGLRGAATVPGLAGLRGAATVPGLAGPSRTTTARGRGTPWLRGAPTVHVVTAAPGEYSIDGVRMPELHMVRGSTYVFDQGADSNVGHPLRIRTAARAPYTDGVVGSGTPGLRGAKTVFTVPQEAPDGLQYYCTEHPSGAGMGGGIVIGGGLYEALRASGAARIELGGVRRIQAAPQLGAQLVYRDSQLNPRSDWSNQDLALWSEGAPDWLKCPLTFEIMRMPVVAQDGFSYELALMKEWAGQTEESTMTSPMTNLPMSLVVYENKSLYHATEQWVAARIQARLHLQRLSVLQVQIAGLLDTLKGKEITIEGLEAASMKEGIHFVVEGLWRMWRALERSRTDDAMVSQIVRRLQGLRGTKEELLALFILQKYRRLVSILEAEVPQALAELGFKLPEARTTGQTAWVAEIEGQAFLGNGYDLSCQGKRWMDPTGECEPWDRRNKGWHADYRWAVTIYKHKQKRALPSLKPLPASDTRRGV